MQQLQAQADLHQQLQQQQQENMAALRASQVQSDLSCAANVTACAELRAGLQQLQQRLEQCCKDVARHADQMLELSEQQQVCVARWRKADSLCDSMSWQLRWVKPAARLKMMCSSICLLTVSLHVMVHMQHAAGS